MNTDLMQAFEKIQKANKEGYAGILPNGLLVDRRECPEGYPVAKNSMFGISEPRCIKCENVTPISQLVKSLCSSCSSEHK